SAPSAAQSRAAAARADGRATRPRPARLHARGAAAVAGRPVHRGGEPRVLEAVRGSGRHLPQRWTGALAVAQGAAGPVREGAVVHAIRLGAAPEGAAPPLDSPSPALALRAARPAAPRARVQADREGDAARADPTAGGLAPGGVALSGRGPSPGAVRRVRSRVSRAAVSARIREEGIPGRLRPAWIRGRGAGPWATGTAARSR